MRYVVGIDPGVDTGLAIYDRHDKKLVQVSSFHILGAMARILELRQHVGPIELRFEDARLRKWFGKKGREALQGAGSIKRDCQIWDDFCRLHLIEFKAIAPANNMTKVDAELFRKLTGWAARTNEHSRDAALMVFGA